MFKAIGRVLESFASLFVGKKPKRPVAVVTPLPTPPPEELEDDVDFELEMAEPDVPEPEAAAPEHRLFPPLHISDDELDRAVDTDKPVRVVGTEKAEAAKLGFLGKSVSRDEAHARKALIQAVKGLERASPAEYARCAGDVVKELLSFPEQLKVELLAFLQGYNPRFFALVTSLLAEARIQARTNSPNLAQKAKTYVEESRGKPLPQAWQEGLEEADKIQAAMDQTPMTTKDWSAKERAARVDEATKCTNDAGFGANRMLSSLDLRDLAKVLPTVEARRPG